MIIYVVMIYIYEIFLVLLKSTEMYLDKKIKVYKYIWMENQKTIDGILVSLVPFS